MKVLQVAGLCALALLVGHGARAAEAPIKIGFPIPLTGEIPKVGEGSKYAAEMLKEEINGKGGLKVGDKMYPLEFIYEDKVEAYEKYWHFKCKRNKITYFFYSSKFIRHERIPLF